MGDFAKDYAFGVDVKPDAELRPAGDLRGHPPSRRAGGDPELYRHPHLGELQRPCRGPRRRRLQEESVHARQSAGGFSQRRRRGGADPQDRLRHDAGRAAGAAAAHARRLRAACQFFRGDRPGPGLRGQPDRRPDDRAEARRTFARDGHPGSRRHPQDRRGRRRLRARGADRREQGEARAGAGERVDGRACNAAAPTAIRASPPIRRSARRAICWCGTAAP